MKMSEDEAQNVTVKLFTFSFEIDAPNITSCAPKIFISAPRISAVRLKIYIW